MQQRLSQYAEFRGQSNIEKLLKMRTAAFTESDSAEGGTLNRRLRQLTGVASHAK